MRMLALGGKLFVSGVLVLAAGAIAIDAVELRDGSTPAVAPDALVMIRDGDALAVRPDEKLATFGVGYVMATQAEAAAFRETEAERQRNSMALNMAMAWLPLVGFLALVAWVRWLAAPAPEESPR